jgi:hypothetical protein
MRTRVLGRVGGKRKQVTRAHLLQKDGPVALRHKLRIRQHSLVNLVPVPNAPVHKEGVAVELGERK